MPHKCKCNNNVSHCFVIRTIIVDFFGFEFYYFIHIHVLDFVIAHAITHTNKYGLLLI